MTEAIIEVRRTLTRSTAQPMRYVAPPQALFKSVRAALAFAYSICDHSIAPSCNLLPPAGGGNSRLLDFSPHEKHAQGALIRRAVEQCLAGLHLALTLAYYGTGKPRAAAVREVCWQVAKIVRKPGLGEELAKRHFSRNGERVSQQQLATTFGLSQQTVSRLDREVANEIDRIRIAAEQQLERLFVRTGVADAL